MHAWTTGYYEWSSPVAACSRSIERCTYVIDLLLPTTDAGVAVQFASILLVGAVGVLLSRKHPDVRLLVIGLTVLSLALMTVRAVH